MIKPPMTCSQARGALPTGGGRDTPIPCDDGEAGDGGMEECEEEEERAMDEEVEPNGGDAETFPGNDTRMVVVGRTLEPEEV